LSVNTQIHKDLIEGSKKNDRVNQKKLYHLYVDAMYSVSVRIIGSSEDAQDVVQESFIHAFTNLSQFRYESTFGAWLKKIVINRSLNFLKKNKIVFEEIFDDMLSTEEDYIIDLYLELGRVKESIELLPNGYRQIMCLYLIEGFDHIEISEILKISESTSRSQYTRAKKKLLQIYNNQ